MSVSFHPYSAAISSFKTHKGHELVLGFENPENYYTQHNAFLGACVGRVANRIYGSNVEVQGQNYPLKPNDGDNITLHGGPKGWAKVDWEGPFTQTLDDGKKTQTVFKHLSPHLDQGFPGEVQAQVTYTSYTIQEDGAEKFMLEVEFEAELTDNSPVDETVISLTNHSHFNVSDNPDSIDGTRFKVFTNKALVKQDGVGEPTGEVESYPDIPEDKSFFTMSSKGPQFDHNFVAVDDLNKGQKIDTRQDELKPLVHMYHPNTDINVKVLSTDPVFQIYSCDGMNIPKLSGEPHGHGDRAGIACEPARPTNAASRPEWKKWATLKKGETYGSKIVFSNWIKKLEE